MAVNLKLKRKKSSTVFMLWMCTGFCPKARDCDNGLLKNVNSTTSYFRPQAHFCSVGRQSSTTPSTLQWEERGGQTENVAFVESRVPVLPKTIMKRHNWKQRWVCSHCSINKVEISNVDSLPNPFMYQRHLQQPKSKCLPSWKDPFQFCLAGNKKVRVGYKTARQLSARSKAGHGRH